MLSSTRPLLGSPPVLLRPSGEKTLDVVQRYLVIVGFREGIGPCSQSSPPHGLRTPGCQLIMCTSRRTERVHFAKANTFIAPASQCQSTPDMRRLTEDMKDAATKEIMLSRCGPKNGQSAHRR